MQEIRDEQKKTWTIACLAAPIVHVASGLPWQEVLLITLLAAGLRIYLGSWSHTPRSHWIYIVVSVLTAGQALSLMENCWPKQRDMEWVMMILLILAAIQAGRGKYASIQGGLLLWWLTALLLGSVLVSAIPEVKLTKLLRLPEKRSWLSSGELLILLLIPEMLELKDAEHKMAPGLLLLPIVCAISTQGVLGMNEAAESKAPFYELSRTVSFYGLLERMEALAWLGLMLGTYLYLSFLLTEASEKAKTTKTRILILAGTIAAAKAAEIYLNRKVLEILILLGITGIWMLTAGEKQAEKIKERKMKKHGKNG